ncbi:two-component system, NarL family, response regulator [Prosthecobacter debontii]|uniref:Two-component system, NarL family, response regulator n=1 Tax=Prosthecobacter debontii TaxID=48467 RepID=A0A1T4YIL1_9BACT|nr:response regulator transcription factor [Prosthecobacter debontii]SKB01697.1 two-component system, NarL family, response regulator [Prosthecobacter debontii]
MKLVPEPTIRVMVVDDHFFTRMGVSAALNLEADMGVVAEAACGQDAIDLFVQHQPDVAVLDGSLPDMHGTEVAREIVKRFDFARLLIFSVEETEEDIHRAVSAGVRGYLPKSSSRPDLVNAVRTVAAGKRFFPQQVLGKLNERRNHVTLSTRELEVLQSMAKGWPNKLIAADMNVSTETIKTFVARILDKLNAEDRVQAVMVALDRGLLKRP